MDAKVGDWVVTPRIGKPVEVQALWLNALWIAAQWAPRFVAPLARGRAAFAARFWNEARGCLYDVVDADHRAGACDATLRPNQILAVGGLPLLLVDGARPPGGRRGRAGAADAARPAFASPRGAGILRPLRGDGPSRDGRYHQGTVWPWLLGPFVEAWVRTHGDDAAARDEAARASSPAPRPPRRGRPRPRVGDRRRRCAPHPARLSFQAWSLGELLRLDREVLAAP
ncbi:MAG: amylo-alpha-1,6-glucosidase [Candidatus Binatia bacterium]